MKSPLYSALTGLLACHVVGAVAYDNHWSSPPPPPHSSTPPPGCSPTTTKVITETRTKTIISTTTAALVTITLPGKTSTVTSCSTTPPPSGPTFSCAPNGFLIQTAALIGVDIPNGKYSTIDQSVGDGQNINALGFNVKDNFLYGFTREDKNIIRIYANGSSETVASFPNIPNSPATGDVDTDGFYWATYKGQAWYQIDLRPGSATYGQLLNNGTSDNNGITAGDWTYIPIAGPYMYTLGHNGKTGGCTKMRWSMITHIWEVVDDYPDLDLSPGALYGVNNGTFFATDNPTGSVYRVSVLPGDRPVKIANAPPTSSNDGARCVLNLLV